jgi:hypothetical protein
VGRCCVPTIIIIAWTKDLDLMALEQAVMSSLARQERLQVSMQS